MLIWYGFGESSSVAYYVILLVPTVVWILLFSTNVDCLEQHVVWAQAVRDVIVNRRAQFSSKVLVLVVVPHYMLFLRKDMSRQTESLPARSGWHVCRIWIPVDRRSVLSESFGTRVKVGRKWINRILALTEAIWCHNHKDRYISSILPWIQSFSKKTRIFMWGAWRCATSKPQSFNRKVSCAALQREPADCKVSGILRSVRGVHIIGRYWPMWGCSETTLVSMF